MPYAAYKADPVLAVEVPVNSTRDLQCELPSTDLCSLNREIAWFALKGASHDDQVAKTRSLIIS